MKKADLPAGAAHVRVALTRSLQVRLAGAFALMVFLAVMAVAAVSGWRYFETQLTNEARLVHGAASAYAAALSEPVAQGSRRETISILRGVRQLDNVLQAEVRTRDGQLLANLGSGAVLVSASQDAGVMSAAEIWRARQMRLRVPIRENGDEVGELRLLTDISYLRAQVLDSVRRTVMLAVTALIASLLIGLWLVSRVTRPLRSLTHLMATFGDDQAGQMQPIAAGRDETGVLAAAFNTMIANISERDARIARHMETLEATVEERTHKMKEARDEAMAANAAKSDFLATMSHEIRTPMNGMLVMAEMLSAADLSTRHRRYADIISRSGRNLLAIINDILDLSKIESGRLELENTSFSLDALIGDVASLFWERAREKQLDLAVHVAPDVPHSIFGDPTRLGQVVTNLVNNALKFTETGGVELAVSCKGEGTGRRLIISVRDTGIGIPEDKIDTIFEAFHQADQSTTRRFGGTGLGLAVCRRLVTAMGGAISVNSQPGKGSVFAVGIPLVSDVEAPRLAPSQLALAIADERGLTGRSLARLLQQLGARLVPMAEADLVLARSHAAGALDCSAAIVLLSDIGDTAGDALLRSGKAVDAISLPVLRSEVSALLERAAQRAFRGEAALVRAETTSALPRFSGLRVLAVDDNAVNREVLREALLTLGLSADFAENGLEAADMAMREAYHVIFMDGSMPELDGFEATRRIRAHEAVRKAPRAQIVALTAQVGETALPQWRDAGADSHVAKPFTLERLVSALSTCAEPDRGGEDQPEAHGVTIETPLFDADTLTRLDGLGSGGLRERVWALFAPQARQGAAALVRAVGAAGSPEDVARCAHALKSMALSSGAARLAEACGALEAAGKAREDRKALAGGVHSVVTVLGETLAAMEAGSVRQHSVSTAA